VPTKHAAGVNAALHKALAHPLRGRIMVVLTEREASPSQLAELLDETLGNTAYHVRKMVDAEVIELVRVEPGRRGMQKIYKATLRPVLVVDDWERLPRILREVNSVWVAQLMVGDLREAIEAGTFDARVGRAMVRVPGVVDEQGWDELEPAAEQWLEAIYDVFAKSNERLSRSGEEGINVATAVLAFEMPPPEQSSLLRQRLTGEENPALTEPHKRQDS
jgi:DNA-binding transcriptional ArsR family regulator